MFGLTLYTKSYFEVFMSTDSIFKSKTEDIVKLFLPTLVIIPLIFLPSLESVAWSLIAILSVFDIGHVLSSGVEPVFDPMIRTDKTILKLICLGIVISAAVVLLFPKHVHKIFFYSLVFHNIRQGLGITLLYYKKSDKKLISAKMVKHGLYFFTVTPVLLFHIRRVEKNFGVLEEYYSVISLENYFNVTNLIQFGSIMIPFLLGGLFLAFIYIKLKTSLSTALSFLFFTGIYIYSYLLTDNLMFSTLLLMASHGIPYFFLIEKRIHLFSGSKNLSRFSYLTMLLSLVLGFFYYYFFYKNVGKFESMSSWTKFFIILPSYIHYSLDAYIWTRRNERFRAFVNS